MDENKVIRPMDFVRLTNIDELNVIKDTKNHIGLVKEVSRDGRMSIIWIGETYSQLPCPRCGLRPLVWEFDNGRATACGCGTDCYSHWSVQAESIMSVIKRSDNGKSAEAYDIDELKNNWNHWVRTGEILFTPGNGRW